MSDAFASTPSIEVASIAAIRDRRRFRIAYVLIALLCLMVLALAYEVGVLKPQAKELRRRKALPYVGQLVPVVRVASLNGDSLTIGETANGRSQVLFFFATSCEFCKATLPEWQALARQLLADSARRFDVYAVSVSPQDSTLAYIAEHELPYPVLRIEVLRTLRLFRVKGVPMTIVVEPNGQIAYVHPSVIASRAQRDSIFDAAKLVATVTAKRTLRPSPRDTMAVGTAPSGRAGATYRP